MLSADGDEPLAPEDHHLLYVDFAQQMAERDRGNYAAAQALQPEIDRQINEMLQSGLLSQEPLYQRMTGASEDG